MQSKTMISLAGFAAMLSLSAPAHAYIDPATGKARSIARVQRP